MITLQATTKDLPQAQKQLKRWFRRNPNRKHVKVNLKKETKYVTRESVLNQ